MKNKLNIVIGIVSMVIDVTFDRKVKVLKR